MQQPKRATLTVRPPPVMADVFVAQGERRPHSVPASALASSDVLAQEADVQPSTAEPVTSGASPLPLDVRIQALSVERQTSDAERLGVLKSVDAKSPLTRHNEISLEDRHQMPGAKRQTSERDVPAFRRASKAMLGRKSSGPVRRTTVYFQVATATGLADHCARYDLEMSAVVDQAVREFLERN